MFNRNEEEVKRRLAVPYMQNRPIMIFGEFVQPSMIYELYIFQSEELYEKLVLPNGKFANEEENVGYVLECFGLRKVEGVSACAYDFITSPPRGKKEPKKIFAKPLGERKEVFIVHGRDEKQALRLQKYLKDKLKVDAVMFDDLPDKGRTIIEQLEYIRDNVGYAFVVVTPDDVGCLTEDIEELGKMLAGLGSVKGQTVAKIFEMLHTRARQNVVFEFGLFMGTLGRKRVCCLLKQDTEERPSDMDGILYKLFNKSVSEIFHEIPEELTEAGYEIKM